MSTNGPHGVARNAPKPPPPPSGGRLPAPPPMSPGCHPEPGRRLGHTVVVGGGSTVVPGSQSAPDRFAQAARGAHRGHAHAPAQPGRPAGGAQPQPVSPELAALVAILGSAAPPAQSPGLAQRIAGQLALMFEAANARLAGLLGGRGSGGAVMGGGPGADGATLPGASQQPDAPAQLAQPVPPPRVPMQPPGPTLTLDPSLGIIVHDDGPNGAPPLGSTPTLGDGAADGARRSLVPSSWVPITNALVRLGEAGRAGRLRLLAGVDRLVERSGLTRGQLVLLTLLAPLLVALLIDVVTSVANGG